MLMTGLAVSLLAAPVLAASPPGAADQSAVRTARLRQNAAIAAHNLDEIASYWTDDVTICRGLGIQLHGKAAYRALFASDRASASEVIYERAPESIDISRTWPLAFETGHWKGRLGGPAGPVVISGRYSAQWVKRQEGWLIRSEVFVALDSAGIGAKMQAAP